MELFYRDLDNITSFFVALYKTFPTSLVSILCVPLAIVVIFGIVRYYRNVIGD